MKVSLVERHTVTIGNDRVTLSDRRKYEVVRVCTKTHRALLSIEENVYSWVKISLLTVR